MSYEEIKNEIKNAPMSLLPGLLMCVVTTSLEKKVFRPGGAARVAKEVEDEQNEINRNRDAQQSNQRARWRKVKYEINCHRKSIR